MEVSVTNALFFIGGITVVLLVVSGSFRKLLRFLSVLAVVIAGLLIGNGYLSQVMEMLADKELVHPEWWLLTLFAAGAVLLLFTYMLDFFNWLANKAAMPTRAHYGKNETSP